MGPSAAPFWATKAIEFDFNADPDPAFHSNADPTFQNMRIQFRRSRNTDFTGRWVAKLVARLLATAALWVRIQTSLKNTKWET